MMLNNKTILTLITGILVGLFSAVGQASDTFQVDVTARIYKESCDLSVNGGGNQGTVPMALSSTADYPNKFSESADTYFDIRLSGCDKDLGSIRLNFFSYGYGSMYSDLSPTACRDKQYCYALLQSSNAGIAIRFTDVSSGSGGCSDWQKIGWIDYDQDSSSGEYETGCPQKIGDVNVFSYIAKAVRVSDEPVQPGPYQAKVMISVAYY